MSLTVSVGAAYESDVRERQPAHRHWHKELMAPAPAQAQAQAQTESNQDARSIKNNAHAAYSQAASAQWAPARSTCVLKLGRTE